MAVAIQMLDDRHLGIAADALDQALAATGNDDVHIVGHGNQLAHGLAVGRTHQLHAVFGQAGLLQCLCHQPGQRLVGIDGFRTTAQDTGIAALDREAGRFNGHIGAAFVNHAEHAQGHAHLPHTNTGGLLPEADDLADHIGHGGQLLATQGAGLQHLGSQAQAVDHGLGQPIGHGTLQILGVIDLQRLDMLAQQTGQGLQCFVFCSCRRTSHQRRGSFCLYTQVVHVFDGIERVHTVIFAEKRTLRRQTRTSAYFAPPAAYTAG